MSIYTEINALRNINRDLELATHFLEGYDYDKFRNDLRTIYAVTHCIALICEASKCLSDDLKARHPTIDWKAMAVATNHLLRSHYEDINAKLIWNTAKHSLPTLRALEITTPSQPTPALARRRWWSFVSRT
jgi:uncharacterized protein with HEPN domain